jgi:GT2 family glycosyltransferase
MRISVVLPISTGEWLEPVLESWAAQALRDFELIVICGENHRPAVAERLGKRVSLAWAPAESNRAAARNAGARVARGELLLFAAEDQLVSSRFLDEVAGEHGAVPELLVARQPVDDFLFARAAPLIARFGERMHGLQLPWLAALAGPFSLPREAFAACGGFDESFLDWDGEDLDLPFRWWSEGRSIRVCAATSCSRVRRPIELSPRALIDDVERFARKHGAFDAWLLWRFLRGDAFDPLHQLALERAAGSAPARELERLSGEILGDWLRAAREWWPR